MMISGLLQNMSNAGITLWTDGDSIHYHTSNGDMPEHLLSQIKENKPALLDHLKHHSYEVNRTPATHSQHALWNIWNHNRNLTAYHTAISMKIPVLDPDLFIEKFNRAVIRHEALRTRFQKAGGNLYQQIFNYIPPEKIVLEVQNESDEKIHQILRREHNKPFDLEKGSPIRLTLLRTGDKTVVFLLTAHHIILDGASGWQLLNEVFEEYSGSTCPAVAEYQMSDFAIWQHRLLSSDAATELSGYWKKTLTGAPLILDMPEDYTRPAEHQFNGSTLPVQFPHELSGKLRKLAKDLDVTLYTLLLTAYQILLSRYTGQSEFLIGSPAGGRSEAEHDQIVGFLVNMIVLRTDLNKNVPFHELVKQTGENVRQAFAHQNYPFQLIAGDLADHIDKSRHPIFQAEFALQQVRGNSDILRLYNPGETKKSLKIGSITVEPFHTSQQEGQFDLGLDLLDLSDEISGMVRYNSDIFEKQSVQQFIDRYITLLNNICNNPQEKVYNYSIVDNAEYELLKKRIKPIRESETPYNSLVDWFDAICNKFPDKIAAEDHTNTVTYKELYISSIHVAQQLANRIPDSDSKKPIGLCMNRSVQLIASIIGILRYGAPYVPLDPSNSESRLNFIIKDSGISCILCDDSHSGLFHDQAILNFDESPEHSLDHPAPVSTSLNPDDIAYIIYTSGSTGKPKGALVNHFNVMRLFTSTEPWFSFNHEDRWMMFHSYAFDFSVWEIWGALLYGGSLFVADADITKLPGQIADLISEKKITVLNQTPSAFYHLSGEILKRDVQNYSSLKRIIFGGEALNTASLKAWFNKFGDQAPELVNMYGITETTVHVTWYRLKKSDTQKHHSPIGIPIPDLGLSIRDQNGNLVPDNIPGELYVSGAGVCQMYLNRETLNSERFLTDEYGNKMYRSGDIVRRLNDGRIVYIGRSDQQIKIRGYRIETGEIEYSIMKHDQVQTAAVGVHESESGKKIIAWCTPAEGRHPDETALIQHVKKLLPDYMAPSFIYILPSLPMTPNGKLDYSKLPKPASTQDPDSIDFNKDSDPKLWIAGICKSVLQKDEIPYHMNFFDLGCDSLSINLIYRKLRDQLGEVIKVTDLYEYPTIELLSQKIAPAQSMNHGKKIFGQKSENITSTDHRLNTGKKSRMELLKERRRRS